MIEWVASTALRRGAARQVLQLWWCHPRNGGAVRVISISSVLCIRI
jgi:hypothetical protein